MTFEEKLRAFFKEHDPGRLRYARKIANKYQSKATDVMSELVKIYAAGGPGSHTAKLEARRNAGFENFSDAFSDDSGNEQVNEVSETPVNEVDGNTEDTSGMIDDLDD